MAQPDRNLTNIDAPSAYRDRIASIDEDGKRKWVFPRKPSGRFYNARTWFSYLLLAIMFSGPFITINSRPFLLLNIIERKFIILGMAFWPQDSYICTGHADFCGGHPPVYSHLWSPFLWMGLSTNHLHGNGLS